MSGLEIVNSAALVAIAAGVAAAARRVSIVVTAPRVDVKVDAPSVDVHVPEQAPVQVKVILPNDIEAVKADSRRVRVEHRQPDGTWHPVGETDIDNEARIRQELATEGRRLVMPDGTIRETE